MSKYFERAKELRAMTDIHYNCAQAVLVPFAEDLGISEEAAFRVAANFGRGMKMAATCGSIAGGLMVLGLFGVDTPPVISDYYKRLRDNHDGKLDCADLLRINKEQGGDRTAHCDSMVFECVNLVEAILREQGKIQTN
ncbi:hypothetical protein lbkm_2229 [Lachnospiraceae bacterium KM106-2]|nr:hypothetical protein lbkm_2229 [Lachnospiraceae bacterium KM106-2]